MLVTVLQCPPGPPTPPVSSSSLWYVAKSWVLNTECKRCPFVFCKLQNPCLPPGEKGTSPVYTSGFYRAAELSAAFF